MPRYSFLLDIMTIEQLKDAEENVDLFMKCVDYQMGCEIRVGSKDFSFPKIVELNEALEELEELFEEINAEISLRDSQLNIPEHDPERMHQAVRRMLEGIKDMKVVKLDPVTGLPWDEKKNREEEEKEWAAQFSPEDLEQMAYDGEVYTMQGNPVEVDGIDHEGFRSPFLILNMI